MQLLNNLHAKSRAQENAIDYTSVTSIAKTDPDKSYQNLHVLMRDKFIALDEDKCFFIYNLILSTGARRVVECGTSYGVSTIYLALAVEENKKSGRGHDDVKVVATEWEEEKAALAKSYWAEVFQDWTSTIDLRVGDLLETLKTDLQEVELVLLDSKLHLSMIFETSIKKSSLASSIQALPGVDYATDEVWLRGCDG